MNDWDFQLERSPWEMALATLKRGDKLSAARFLTLLEQEDEQAAEEAAMELESLGVELTVEDLPAVSGSGETALRLREEVSLIKTGRLPSGLGENDPLRLYLEEVERLAQVPMSPLDPDALTAKMLPRVVEIAKGYAGKGVLLLDLIQEGSLGMWQAVVNEEPENADWWIRQAMTRTITLQARAAGAGDALREALEKYKKADRELLTRLGHNATAEEIAQELGTTPAVAEELRRQMEAVRAVEQVKSAMQPKEQTPEDDQAVEDTAYFRMRSRIAELLSTLEPADAQILTLRFGLEGGKPLTTEETAQKMNMTTAEAQRREMNALAKLRMES